MSAILTTNFDTSKIWLGDNEYITAEYTNSTGSEVELAEGRLMGRVFATNKVLPQAAASTDGSQLPFAVLKGSYTVANGATATVWLCVKGLVDRNMISLASGNTLATALTVTDSGSATVPQGTIEDVLRSRGNIYLIASEELTSQDNQ